MINLRKPLEGVPGLFLLAALVLFGATIGISLALLWAWVPMNEAMANFLGGVVGAGLGAALAVLGSVYLYERGRREDRAPLLVELHTTLDGIIACLREVRKLAATRQSTMVAFLAQTNFLYNHSVELAVARYLPKPINAAAKDLRERIVQVLEATNGHIATPTETPLPSPEQLSGVLRRADALLAQVKALE